MKLSSFKEAKILVIGDIILDIYIDGTVSRLTPDAPVPVLQMKNKNFYLGGAGNVAMNISNLGGNVEFIGLCGEDENGIILENLLKNNNINSKLFKTPNPTTTKINIIGEREEGEKQKIVRIDIEEKIKLNSEKEHEIFKYLSDVINNFDSIIISDYLKGVCTESICKNIIKLANKNSIPVLIDPKGTNWIKYSDATLIKPNLNELSEVVNSHIENEDDTIVKSGTKIKNRFNINYLLITRAQKGGTLLSSDKHYHFYPNADKIINVIGAGDTFISTLALCFATKLPISDSINVANHASGIVISKEGTESISLEELEYKLTLKNRINKLIEISSLSRDISMIKNNNKKIVFTNGYFDQIQNSHIELLKKSKELGDVLIVGVNSDESARNNSRKLSNLEEIRMNIISSIQYVDFVVLFDNERPDNILKIILPDLLVKGGNYDKNEIIGKEYAKEHIIIPITN